MSIEFPPRLAKLNRALTATSLAEAWRELDTQIVKPAVIVAIVAIMGFSWLGFRKYRCSQRGAVLRLQVGGLKRDAQQTLKIGSDKTELEHFFTAHGVSFSIVDSQAFGSIQTTGCAPFGYGSDAAFITIRVKVDGLGSVKQEPIVGAVYKDCL
jgi:hypothetical protein